MYSEPCCLSGMYFLLSQAVIEPPIVISVVPKSIPLRANLGIDVQLIILVMGQYVLNKSPAPGMPSR